MEPLGVRAIAEQEHGQSLPAAVRLSKRPIASDPPTTAHKPKPAARRPMIALSARRPARSVRPRRRTGAARDDSAALPGVAEQHLRSAAEPVR